MHKEFRFIFNQEKNGNECFFPMVTKNCSDSFDPKNVRMRLVMLLCRIFWGLLLCVVPASLWGQGRPLSSRWISLDAYNDSLLLSVPTATANPGALARQQVMALHFTGERRYMLPGLYRFQAGGAVPSSAGGWGFMADHERLERYSRLSAGLAYARVLYDGLQLGGVFNYTTISYAGISRVSAASMGMGMLFRFSDHVRIGFHFQNAAGLRFSAGSDQVAGTVYAAGLGWDISSLLSLSVEFVKQAYGPVQLNAGLVYRPAQRIQVRLGVSDGVQSFFAGAGMSLKTIRFELVSNFHPYLGSSPALRVGWVIKSKRL
ncbi:MAG: hypothetical protein J0H92_00750 [Sphingobacteriales bacterium]|nr:hypothetical protein [Sphingobacteriales bacterium]OJW33582.1 MAG: hypothetical protein BGO54_10050 [Sphingobacteriales bacterium 46-32]